MPQTAEKSPSFQWFPKDFLSSSKVQQMSYAEVGVYTILLNRAWLDKGLPNDVGTLARLLKIPHRQFMKMWNGPLGQCFTVVGDRLVSPRQEAARAEQAEFREQQKARIDKRWAKHRNASGNTTVLPGPYAAGNTLLSASASANKDQKTTTSSSRGAPLVAKRKPWAAFEGSRSLDVPAGLHQKFRDRLNRPDAEAVLFAWYAEVCDEWTTGARKDDQPGTDLPLFWNTRFDEKWPPAAKADPRIPAWARS